MTEQEELYFLRDFYWNVRDYLGPASDDIVKQITVSYMENNNAELDSDYFFKDEEEGS